MYNASENYEGWLIERMILLYEDHKQNEEI
mgnify:FL=1